ncbi:3776_t:CDS:2 [Entrophospora sp. SA101]|nr:3776_t:CDS:2 [Entrophospora sp. SA101]
MNFKNEVKKSLIDWSNLTDDLIMTKDEDTETRQIKKYPYEVMSPIIKSFTKPIPFITATNTIDDKSADLLTWSWETGEEEIFIGEQAGPPTKPDLMKLATGYLFEIKMVLMWKDGVYVYEEFGSLTIPSNYNQIHTMKAELTVKEEVTKKEVVECNNDIVQVLKREYREIVQTTPSPKKSKKNN